MAFTQESTEGDTCALAFRFVSWLEANEGSIIKLRLEDLGGEMGLGLITKEAVRKGEPVMSVPKSICMTIDSAMDSELEVVLKANSELMDTPDEVMALHLMNERKKGEESFWKEYLRTLPDDVDTPLRWVLEGEGAAAELRQLDGTMVGLLSKMMLSQLVRDWEELHLPLIEVHPEVLGGLRFEDYVWAMSSIWSRSFDYQEQGSDRSRERRCRAMVPVLNTANHHPSAADHLSDIVQFEAFENEGTEKGTTRESTEEGTKGVSGGRLRVIAGRDYGAGEQFYILYGRYSNAKLLYSYGFVLPDNPYGGLDYWVKVPPNDPGFAWKQTLLDGHSLTRTQAYDFSGTLRAGGWVSPALLATARTAQLTPEEKPIAENAFLGKMVSPRNEMAALGALLAGLRRKLAGQSSTASEEMRVVASLEAELERQQQQQQQQELVLRRRASEEREPGKNGRSKDEADDDGQLRSEKTTGCVFGAEGGDGFVCPRVSGEGVRVLQRNLSAARVRLEEKAVMNNAIVALEKSLLELKVAVSGSSGGALASFRTLDSR